MNETKSATKSTYKPTVSKLYKEVYGNREEERNRSDKRATAKRNRLLAQLREKQETMKPQDEIVETKKTLDTDAKKQIVRAIRDKIARWSKIVAIAPYGEDQFRIVFRFAHNEEPFINHEIYDKGEAFIYTNELLKTAIETEAKDHGASVGWNNTATIGWLSEIK